MKNKTFYTMSILLSVIGFSLISISLSLLLYEVFGEQDLYIKYPKYLTPKLFKLGISFGFISAFIFAFSDKGIFLLNRFIKKIQPQVNGLEQILSKVSFFPLKNILIGFNKHISKVVLFLALSLIIFASFTFFSNFDFTDEGLYLYLLSQGSQAVFISPFYILLHYLGELFNHQLIGYRFLTLIF